ncbi:MAG: hypothetical protein AAFY60_02910 [Myxococcota bacterium]
MSSLLERALVNPLAIAAGNGMAASNATDMTPVEQDRRAMLEIRDRAQSGQYGLEMPVGNPHDIIWPRLELSLHSHHYAAFAQTCASNPMLAAIKLGPYSGDSAAMTLAGAASALDAIRKNAHASIDTLTDKVERGALNRTAALWATGVHIDRYEKALGDLSSGYFQASLRGSKAALGISAF